MNPKNHLLGIYIKESEEQEIKSKNHKNKK
jgi:hypothetical protein